MAASLPSARRKKLPSVAVRKAEAPIVCSILLNGAEMVGSRTHSLPRVFQRL